MKRAAALVAASVLASISALHFLWATGSAWPASRQRAITGAPEGHSPGPLACIAVGKLLAIAASLVAGFGQNRAILRFGRNVVAVVLAVRGLAGVTGKTAELVPGYGITDEFKQLDRRFFGPLCLLLAALIFGSRPRVGRQSGRTPGDDY